MSVTSLEQRAINTIRTLSMDAVQAANSGHPGTPMALAPVAYSLWHNFLRYDPEHPQWPGRDRFVLSCGHASMLLYSVLHLAGVRQLDADGEPTDQLAVPLEDIRNFRQWDSRCPGHPEWHHTSGVETTTGPLGQGIGNSVGMAIAQRWLASRYNRPGYDLFDYNVYALCSDGDLMEGVGAEAASLAGHLKLSNLCWVYDDNRITIEGGTELAFSDDVAARFEGYGWHVIRVDDANDLDALGRAFQSFQQRAEQPTLIIVESHIAWGAPNKQGTADAHGAALGQEEVRLTKEIYGWPPDEHFLVPDDVVEHFRSSIVARGRSLYDRWQSQRKAYAEAHPELSAELDTMWRGALPAGWDADLPEFPADPKGQATRASGGKALNAVAKHIPWLVGGSADLAPSTKTTLTFDGAGSFGPEQPGGRNFHFGVREHAMAAALNGLALSGLRPYGSTFLVFSDYCRGSKRLSALMGLPVIYIYTHDSIGVGEDGPTHQPIEHLAALRAMPNMTVIRPADANEVSQAWRTILPRTSGPVSLILTRQNLPTLDRTKFASAAGLSRGGYVLYDSPGGAPQIALLASGSEVSISVAALDELEREGLRVRLVSMPSFELFDQQDKAYRDQVLPPSLSARVAIEAGVQQGWEKYLGPGGRFIGLDHFGASAPAEVLFEKFGLTPQRVVAEAKAVLAAQ